MYVYLQAYEPDVQEIHPLVSFVSFYPAGTKVFETQPALVKNGLNTRLKTLALSFNIATDQLSLREYDCQVTVLDPAGHKAAFWRAPVMLVP